jgi:hypothetical protein
MSNVNRAASKVKPKVLVQFKDLPPLSLKGGAAALVKKAINQHFNDLTLEPATEQNKYKRTIQRAKFEYVATVLESSYNEYFKNGRLNRDGQRVLLEKTSSTLSLNINTNIDGHVNVQGLTKEQGVGHLARANRSAQLPNFLPDKIKKALLSDFALGHTASFKRGSGVVALVVASAVLVNHFQQKKSK